MSPARPDVSRIHDPESGYDVAIAKPFGPSTLERFRVWTDETFPQPFLHLIEP
jgi:hypothetical protein